MIRKLKRNNICREDIMPPKMPTYDINCDTVDVLNRNHRNKITSLFMPTACRKMRPSYNNQNIHKNDPK